MTSCNQPQLVKLVNSKDSWRLVGATKSILGRMGTEAHEKVTEARIAVKVERLERGQVRVEPKQALEPGEYAVVLGAIHPGTRVAGSLGGVRKPVSSFPFGTFLSGTM